METWRDDLVKRTGQDSWAGDSLGDDVYYVSMGRGHAATDWQDAVSMVASAHAALLNHFDKSILYVSVPYWEDSELRWACMGPSEDVAVDREHGTDILPPAN